MTDKKYTHKIVMYDVNGLVRTARFASEVQAVFFKGCAIENEKMVSDNSGTIFNLNSIVQINPVEKIEQRPTLLSVASKRIVSD